MKFKGLQKLSVIDYSENLCAIGFTGGCNFRCHYCHNPELVIGWEKLPDIAEAEVIDFMQKRKGLLDGLSITGGEPTLHQSLSQFMSKIKKLGFLIKLDTNGTNSEMLSYVIEKRLVDYIAMDIKATPEKYEEVVGVKVNISEIEKSIEVIMRNKIDYEFRTTVFPQFFGEKDAEQISKWLKGANRYVLQKPRVIKTLNGKLKKAKLYTDSELKELAQLLPNCMIR
ncbi:anaerobic ribonucleoside-triphosphate reductase activating protein [candidate division WOR-3 bacterium]|nr:anaerobic ribonucleoside-triphosphate reductase activating protein [candidate division WOR-3 bacterium]